MDDQGIVQAREYGSSKVYLDPKASHRVRERRGRQDTNDVQLACHARDLTLIVSEERNGLECQQWRRNVCQAQGPGVAPGANYCYHYKKT